MVPAVLPNHASSMLITESLTRVKAFQVMNTKRSINIDDDILIPCPFDFCNKIAFQVGRKLALKNFERLVYKQGKGIDTIVRQNNKKIPSSSLPCTQTHKRHSTDTSSASARRLLSTILQMSCTVPKCSQNGTHKSCVGLSLAWLAPIYTPVSSSTNTSTLFNPTTDLPSKT